MFCIDLDVTAINEICICVSDCYMNHIICLCLFSIFNANKNLNMSIIHFIFLLISICNLFTHE